jgi:hypothetical protein
MCAARDGFHMDILPFENHPTADSFFSNSSQMMDKYQIDCSMFQFSSMTPMQTADTISHEVVDVAMSFKEKDLHYTYLVSTTCSLFADHDAGLALSDGYYQWYLRFMAFSNMVKGKNLSVNPSVECKIVFVHDR